MIFIQVSTVYTISVCLLFDNSEDYVINTIRLYLYIIYTIVSMINVYGFQNIFNAALLTKGPRQKFIGRPK